MNARKKYTYTVEAQDIDFRRRISLVSLTNFVLITAGRNADENGFGLLALQTKNYTWVLSRLVIDMERMPTEEEVFSIETWVQDVGTVFTTRNFRLSDKAGTTIGYATSTWAVIDMKTRRSVNLDNLAVMRDYILPQSIPIGEPGRIPSATGAAANTFTVKYSDIDVNGHANTLHYVRWISDCFSLNFYKEHFIRRFEINFLQELTYGDQGEVQRESGQGGEHTFQIVTRDRGPACRARLVFNSN